MSGASVTTASTLMCPHGGTVTIISANPRARAGGAPIATIADTFMIVGCPFVIVIPPATPSPCVMVQWIIAATRLKAGASAIDAASVGLCIAATGAPQGAVVVLATQSRVTDQ